MIENYDYKVKYPKGLFNPAKIGADIVVIYVIENRWVRIKSIADYDVRSILIELTDNMTRGDVENKILDVIWDRFNPKPHGYNDWKITHKNIEDYTDNINQKILKEVFNR